MKIVQIPRGTTEQEDNIIGPAGQLRHDTSRNELRLHDGVTQGGHRLPNVQTISALLAQGDESSAGDLFYFANEAAMKAITPKTGMIAVVAQSGLEDIFVWQAGVAADEGAVASDVAGHWQRLDGRVGFYVRLWRAGTINMQINGVQPAANQDITAWIDNGTVKLWNGANYLAATPVLFARLLSKIGNYAGTIILPDQLAEILIASADLNAETKTGWKKSSAADGNAPSATVSPVFTYYVDANTAYQSFMVAGSNGDSWWRNKAAGAWGAWKFVMGALATRLEAVTTAVADANTPIDSGWYNVAGAASNIPVAETGTLFNVRRSASEATQIYTSTANNKMYFRRYVGSVWQAWVPIYPADVTVASGTLPRVNVGISTISQAEAEAGTATTDRIFTAERIYQAIRAIGGTAADYLANTANRLWNSLWSAASPVNLGNLSGNIALNGNSFLNAYGVLTANAVFNSFSNMKSGQSGFIDLTFSGGPWTLGYTPANNIETISGAGLTLGTGKNRVGYYFDGTKLWVYVAGRALA